MSVSIAIYALVACLGFSVGAERKDAAFSSWKQAKEGTESLVVEYKKESKDLVTLKQSSSTFVFRLLQIKGKIYASVAKVETNLKAEKVEQRVALLADSTIYLYGFGPEEETAVRLEFKPEELRSFLQRHFDPFVVLLDRKKTSEQYDIALQKTDKNYTYLSIDAKQNQFPSGQVVVMNKDSEFIPKNMPRLIRHIEQHQQQTVDIQSWRINPINGPKTDDFTVPKISEEDDREIQRLIRWLRS
jgi:hypothetical protein